MALKNLFKFGRKKKKEDEIEKELEVVEELEEKKAQIEEEIKKEVSKISEEIVKDIDSSLEKIDKKTEKTKEKPKLKPLKDRLATPKKGFFGKLKEMLLGKTIDDDLYEELEELLIQSDIGMNMTIKLVEELEKSVAKKRLKTSEAVYEELKELLKEKLINNNKENTELKLKDGQLNIILVVGVNGVGKTTSIGKIAKKLKDEGKKVIIGAGIVLFSIVLSEI